MRFLAALTILGTLAACESGGTTVQTRPGYATPHGGCNGGAHCGRGR